MRRRKMPAVRMAPAKRARADHAPSLERTWGWKLQDKIWLAHAPPQLGIEFAAILACPAAQVGDLQPA